jgi:hypothetical protein
MRWWIGQEDEDDLRQAAFVHPTQRSSAVSLPVGERIAIVLLGAAEAGLWLTLGWIAISRISL